MDKTSPCATARQERGSLSVPYKLIPALPHCRRRFKACNKTQIFRAVQLHVEQDALKQQLAEERRQHAVQVQEAVRANDELREHIRRIRGSAAGQTAQASLSSKCSLSWECDSFKKEQAIHAQGQQS